MVYEAFLLLAVEALSLTIFTLATGARHTPTIDRGAQFVFFLTAAAYFIHFWTSSGFTLAMKTWRIKLVKVGYPKVPVRVAAVRFLCAWGWFLPGLAACYVFQLRPDNRYFSVAIGLGMLAWGLTAFLDKDRQFLHDRLAGTRLIQLPKPEKKAKAATA